MYFGIVGPGSMNDNVGITMCGRLMEVINDLPLGRYMLGDAAYTLSERLLIPFSGPSCNKKQNDTFSFYLSQVRIRIEMAFGMLVNRFRILKKPLESSMKRNSRTILACAILHNFVLNDTCNDGYDGGRSMYSGDDTCRDTANNDTAAVDLVCDEEWIGDYAATGIEDNCEVILGFSMTQTTIVNFLKNNGYRRPQHNLLRNGRL